jgi:omega-6 fatty acid desaturase (delta-12 desaturase)
MGKGGSAAAAVAERSSLANTLPLGDKITKKSIREAIPANLFVRSYTHSFAVLAWDLVMVAFALAMVHYAESTVLPALPAVCTPVAWMGYWWYQGLTFTGLWVLAHECGHGGFTDSRLVNDTVGFVLHSSLLSPYFSWAITHAKHHHYTNHMTMGETWVPATANPNKPSVKAAKTTAGTWKRIAIIFFAGWYAYLINNATGAKQNKGQSHFSPSSKGLFKRKDANYVRASNVGMMIALSGVVYAISTLGFVEVLRSYLIPVWIANFYLATITFMQHTHPDVPHFEDADWTWLRGALSTIDRSLGPFADYKTHYIVSSHVCHHTFSEMPFYGAEAATPYIKSHLGKYYKSAHPKPFLGFTYLGFWRDFYDCMCKSVTVGKEEDGYLWFH